LFIELKRGGYFGKWQVIFGKFRLLKLKAENTIRWRQSFDMEGKSLAKFIR